MGRLRLALFATLALGYAAVGFVAGQYLLQSVLEIDPLDFIPLPGLAIQAIGFVLALVPVVGGTISMVRLLSLDEM